MQARVDAKHAGADPRSAGAAGEGRRLMEQLRGQIDVMMAEEDKLLGQRQADDEASATEVWRLAVLAAASAFFVLILLFGWLAVAMHRRGLAERAALQLARDLERRQAELEQAIAARDAAEAERAKREQQLRQEQMLYVSPHAMPFPGVCLSNWRIIHIVGRRFPW